MTYLDVRTRELGGTSPLNPVAGSERCDSCGRVSRVGFHVPDEIWRAAVPTKIRGRGGDLNGALCVVCFGELADDRLIEWDADIQFFPVSAVTCIRQDTGIDLRPQRWRDDE